MAWFEYVGVVAVPNGDRDTFDRGDGLSSAGARLTPSGTLARVASDAAGTPIGAIVADDSGTFRFWSDAGQPALWVDFGMGSFPVYSPYLINQLAGTLDIESLRQVAADAGASAAQSALSGVSERIGTVESSQANYGVARVVWTTGNPPAAPTGFKYVDYVGPTLPPGTSYVNGAAYDDPTP